jgi:hypothetical protein
VFAFWLRLTLSPFNFASEIVCFASKQKQRNKRNKLLAITLLKEKDLASVSLSFASTGNERCTLLLQVLPSNHPFYKYSPFNPPFQKSYSLIFFCINPLSNHRFYKFSPQSSFLQSSLSNVPFHKSSHLFFLCLIPSLNFHSTSHLPLISLITIPPL